MRVHTFAIVSNQARRECADLQKQAVKLQRRGTEIDVLRFAKDWLLWRAQRLQHRRCAPLANTCF